MAWNEEMYAKALRMRDEFEAKIQAETAESIARITARPSGIKRALLALLPDWQVSRERDMQVVVATIKASLREAAVNGAKNRIAMKGLSQQQRAQLGYYLIGTSDEGNALLDELNEAAGS